MVIFFIQIFKCAFLKKANYICRSSQLESSSIVANEFAVPIANAFVATNLDVLQVPDSSNFLHFF